MNNTKITAAQLQQLLEDNIPVTIVDVRPQEQRDEWLINGSIHTDVYEGLKQGHQNVLDHLQLNRAFPVVTVCAGGVTAVAATEILNNKGYEAYTLEGGMKAWNYAWSLAEITDGALKIIQVRRVAKGCISYIIGSRDEAIVIDAALDPSVYQNIAKKNGWKIKLVMDTHVHADYISRTKELVQISEAKHLFSSNADVDYDFLPIAEGEKIHFGDSVLEAIYTPGHTPESISYYINGRYLFTGDTLFVEGVGRPDLKADKDQAVKKADQLFESLNKIKALPSQTIILPAHTSQSVSFDRIIIGAELEDLKRDISLLQLSKEDFISQTIERIPPTPPNYITIATLNKKGSYEGINPADLEAGANRCAVS